MTAAYHKLTLYGEQFFLLPQKAVFRPEKKQLILSDVHLGKATHFRKQGLNMPPESHLKDIDALHYLINTWQPVSVFVLGDLFHSSYNNEWLWLKSFMLSYPLVQFTLIEGNHDILKDQLYETIPNLEKKPLAEEENFIFSHHPIDHAEKLNFCGHLHPGLRLQGKAKQTEKLPCFLLNGNHFVLPAFGHLTGLCLLETNHDSSYYLITGTRVIPHG